ncbi:dihydrolipoyllysine-residue acetyltransferase [Sulfuricystis multivorans]|uniref:dihydrolipoyllysine-residue acetyltransferase n=1 Tax=Sulfuricystis multivorans TaxID=2211108 RepID=UPI0024DFD5C8|nr:dihydrolipoyllysine-residue acetyltransferase [Sulfuricystis multivorans]
MDIQVPDIGDFKDVPVIEIHVKPGDEVKAEDALITLESDKATMDVPSPAAGIVKEVKVKLGDKVSEGTSIVVLEPAAQAPAPATPAAPAPEAAARTPEAAAAQTPEAAAARTPEAVPAPVVAPSASAGPVPPTPTIAILPPPVRLPSPAEIVAELDGVKPHASPSVRRFARELGVDIAQVKGSGPKGRITHQDVQAFVKAALAGGAVPSAPSLGAGLNLPPWPQVDFAKFGPVERKPLSRIKKISGPNLARNWVMIPAVTYHEDADVTELEALRVTLNKENEKTGIKITMLAFIIKAAVAALKKYPELNGSLDGDEIVYKNYWHIGFAADTPNGLVVPVLKEADKKGVIEIAQETAELAKKAREGKLSPTEMQGASFTISSVGGIGGTAFSPIVNAPEVAILGVSKASIKPVWNGQEFVPRLILPLSLSADHRVIDGALATRFNAYLAQLLGDFRRVLL